MAYELVYGTHNPSKIAQVQAALADTDITVVGLGDVDFVVDEDGTSPEENARKKAVEYASAIGRPVLSMDVALYFDDLPANQQPGLYVRRIPGHESASDEALTAYYTKLIADHGGTIHGYWEFSYALGYPDRTSQAFTARTHRTFVSTPHSAALPGYPLESLQIDPESGKYLTEFTPQEQAEAWRKSLGQKLAAFIQQNIEDLL